MTANMREALEVAKNFITDHAEAGTSWIGIVDQIDAALSAVPAPVSEEEIARVIFEHINSYETQRLGVHAAAEAILSRLSRTEGDTEESIRTRLDDQHVKSSGGVRTSTGKE